MTDGAPWWRVTLKGWHRNLALSLFGLVCFIFFLALTFPADAARARLQAEAQRTGLVLRMDSFSTGLFSVTASRVRLSRASDADAVPLLVDQLSLRPTFSRPACRCGPDSSAAQPPPRSPALDSGCGSS